MFEVGVDAVGVVTAVGRTAIETLRSIQTDISRVRVSPYVSRTGERFVVAPVLEVRPDLFGVERARLLALSAFNECLAGMTFRGPVYCVVGVDWCVPLRGDVTESGDRTAVQYQVLAKEVHSLLVARGVPIVETRAVPVSSQQALILEGVTRMLEAGRAEHVLWAGVSSACDPYRLEYLDACQDRADPSRRYPIVGGEAAAVVALGAGDRSARRLKWAFSSERYWTGREPSQGSALTRVLQDVSRGLPKRGAGVSVLLDVPDSPALMSEWSMATLRSAATLGGVEDIKRPAALFGQVGAATLPLYAALTWADEEPAIAVVATDGSRRTALRVDRT